VERGSVPGSHHAGAHYIPPAPLTNPGAPNSWLETTVMWTILYTPQVIVKIGVALNADWSPGLLTGAQLESGYDDVMCVMLLNQAQTRGQ